MAHPLASQCMDVRERAKSMIGRTGNGAMSGDMREDQKMASSAIRQHESHDHPSQPKTKLKFAAGGAIDGDAARASLGKRARGGSAKKSTHVNVIVAPQGGNSGGMQPARPMAPPMPPPRPPMPMAPPMAAPASPAGLPPQAMGGLGPKPPGMMRRGGTVRPTGSGQGGARSRTIEDKGGNIDHAKPNDPLRAVQKTVEVGEPYENLMQANRGGHVSMDAGGGGGEGRIEKARIYGKGGFQPKDRASV